MVMQSLSSSGSKHLYVIAIRKNIEIKWRANMSQSHEQQTDKNNAGSGWLFNEL